jgi:hypothetical protein
MCERRQTDMKEKYVKPEVSVLMNIVIVADDQNQNDNGLVVGDLKDIFVSMVPGDGGENWD